MGKMYYYLAYDDGNLLIRANNSEEPANVLLQRYSKEEASWVDDYDMCGIYSGDIPVKVITEAEANKLIAEM